jgi:hypothetical protein
MMPAQQKLEYQCAICGRTKDTLFGMLRHYKKNHENCKQRRYIMRVIIPAGDSGSEPEIVMGETLMSLEYDANDPRTG